MPYLRAFAPKWFFLFLWQMWWYDMIYQDISWYVIICQDMSWCVWQNCSIKSHSVLLIARLFYKKLFFSLNVANIFELPWKDGNFRSEKAWKLWQMQLCDKTAYVLGLLYWLNGFLMVLNGFLWVSNGFLMGLIFWE